jgi:hypothetical protein
LKKSKVTVSRAARGCSGDAVFYHTAERRRLARV